MIDKFANINLDDLNVIMTYDNFIIFIRDGKTFCHDDDGYTFEVEEIARLNFGEYEDMADVDLIFRFSCDFSGELDDCTGYIYYIKKESII